MANLKEVRDVCHGKKYTTKTGEERTTWTKVGAMFVYDNGNLSLKLDFIPVGDPNGVSLAVFKKRDKNQQSKPVAQAPVEEASMDDLDEIFGSDAA